MFTVKLSLLTHDIIMDIWIYQNIQFHTISTCFFFQLGVKLPLNYKVIYILPPDFSGRRVVRPAPRFDTPSQGIPGDLRDRITRFLSLD